MNAPDTPPADELLVATFLLGDAAFGIDTAHVQEVIKVGDITPVHHAPPDVRGIRNLRGRIVTVLDLRARLELGSVEPTGEQRILIVEWRGEPVGLMVDRVTDTLTVPAGTLDTHLRARGGGNRHVRGVCRSAERLVALLDLDGVLEDGPHPEGSPP